MVILGIRVALVRGSAVLLHRRAPLLFIFQSVRLCLWRAQARQRNWGVLAIIRGQTVTAGAEQLPLKPAVPASGAFFEQY
jgi:hypothetical protein